MNQTRLILVFLLLLFSLSCLTARGEERAYTRWAIISSPEIKETGLADILFVKALEIKGIDLVERDEIDAVLKEMEVSALSAVGVSERVKLGERLQADALAIISIHRERKREGEKDVERSYVKLVLADCHYGARLKMDVLPDEGSLETKADRVTEIITEIREKYADGIKQIIGVVPFVSKNFVHDYDYLQASYAYLLQNKLAELRGVAVLEVEEAKAIREEKLKIEEDARKRIVPILVSGEFEANTRKAQVVIRVRMRTADGDGGEVRSGPVALDKAAQWISGELSRRIFREMGRQERPALDVQAQFDGLIEQADMFALIGSWHHSTGLREAALLLKSDDVAQRTYLAREYGQYSRGVWSKTYTDKERGRAGARGQKHLEYLVRNRHIDLQTAVPLCSALADPHFLLAVGPVVSSLPLGNGIEEKIRNREIYSSPLDNWARLVGKVAAEPFREQWPKSKKDLTTAKRLLTEVLPDKCEAPFEVFAGFLDMAQMGKRRSPTRESGTESAITVEDWLAFLDDLKESDHKLASILGRYGLATWKYWNRSMVVKWSDSDGALREYPGSPEEMGALLDEMNSLIEDFLALGYQYGHKGTRKETDLYRLFLPDLRAWIAKGLVEAEKAVTLPATRPSSHTSAGDVTWWRPRNGTAESSISMVPPAPRENPVRAGAKEGRTNRPAQKQAREEPDTGRLRFSTLNLTVRTLSGQTNALDVAFMREYGFKTPGYSARSSGILRCTEDWDVWWTRKAILYSKNQQILEEVLVRRESTDRILDVTCDGGNVWVVNGHNPRGVLVFDKDGKLRATITEEQGLPPSNKGLLACGIDKGRALVVGSHGPHRRAWCAIVDIRGPEPRVSVFHTATRVAPPGRKSREYAMDPSIAFVPSWIHEYDHGRDDGSRVFLVGRREIDPGAQPLFIETTTSNVWTLGYDLLYPGEPSGSFFSTKGELFHNQGSYVLHYKPLGETWENWQKWRRCCDLQGKSNGVSNPGNILLAHDGYLYVSSGSKWIRMNLANTQEEVLLADELPYPYIELTKFGVSAHYDLVGWSDNPGNTNTFYKILIVDDQSQKSRIAEQRAHRTRKGTTMSDGLRPGNTFAKEAALRKRLAEQGLEYHGLEMDAHGDCALELRDVGTDDLTRLREIPLKSLVLLSCPGITDISPLAGLSLRSLNLRKTNVSDLSPLKGMPLEKLSFGCTQVTDLSPLRDCPLEWLDLKDTKVSNLSPLKGMALKSLYLSNTEIRDLAPLAGMPLESLWLTNTKVEDLSPLRGIRLRTLGLNNTQVTDLSPLSGMPLNTLLFCNTPVEDVVALKAMPLERLELKNTKVRDISALEGMQFTYLELEETRVRDLSPLKGMPLQYLSFPMQHVVDGIPVVRAMNSLKLINSVSPDDFWDYYDVSERWQGLGSHQ